MATECWKPVSMDSVDVLQDLSDRRLDEAHQRHLNPLMPFCSGQSRWKQVDAEHCRNG